MENAASSLKIAFAVMLFVIALTLSMSSFSQARIAVNAIISAGGIPVWAHPLGGEGEVHISEEEFYKKFEVMKSIGIRGLECHYSRYDKKEAEFLVKVAKENGLFITGGSDYHGWRKPGTELGVGRGNLRVDFGIYEELSKRKA